MQMKIQASKVKELNHALRLMSVLLPGKVSVIARCSIEREVEVTPFSLVWNCPGCLMLPFRVPLLLSILAEGWGQGGNSPGD